MGTTPSSAQGLLPVVFRGPCSAGGQTELRHKQASALTLYSSLDTPWCTPDLLLGARGCATGAVLLACAQPVSSAVQTPALGEETAAPTTPDAAASTEDGGVGRGCDRENGEGERNRVSGGGEGERGSFTLLKVHHWFPPRHTGLRLRECLTAIKMSSQGPER